MSNFKKAELLEENNYVFNFVKLLYINDTTKKIFSIQVLKKKDIYWIKKKMNEENNTFGWQVYFSGGMHYITNKEFERII